MSKITFHDSVLVGVEHMRSDKKLILTFEFNGKKTAADFKLGSGVSRG